MTYQPSTDDWLSLERAISDQNLKEAQNTYANSPDKLGFQNNINAAQFQDQYWKGQNAGSQASARFMPQGTAQALQKVLQSSHGGNGTGINPSMINYIMKNGGGSVQGGGGSTASGVDPYAQGGAGGGTQGSSYAGNQGNSLHNASFEAQQRNAMGHRPMMSGGSGGAGMSMAGGGRPMSIAPSQVAGFAGMMPSFTPQAPQAPAPQQSTLLGTPVGPGVREYNFGPPQQQQSSQPMQDVSRYDMKQSPDSGLGGSFKNQFDTNDEGYKPSNIGGTLTQQFAQPDNRQTSFQMGASNSGGGPSGYWDNKPDFLANSGQSASGMNSMYPKGLYPDATDKGTGGSADYSDPKYGNHPIQGGTQQDVLGSDYGTVQQNHAAQSQGKYDPEFFKSAEAGDVSKPVSPVQNAMMNDPNLLKNYWQSKSDGGDGTYSGGQGSAGTTGTTNGLPDFLKPLDAPGMNITSGGANGRQTQLNRDDNLYSGTTIDRMFGNTPAQRDQSMGLSNGSQGQQSASSSAGFQQGYTPDQWRQGAQQQLNNFNGQDMQVPFAQGANGQILPPMYAPQYTKQPGQNYPDPIQSGQIDALMQQQQQQQPQTQYNWGNDSIYDSGGGGDY